MKKGIADDSISIEEKLSRFESTVNDLQEIITMIQHDPLGQEKITDLMRDRLDLSKIRRISRHLSQFLLFPEKDRRVKHPDSDKERQRFAAYRQKGLSLRAISKQTGIPVNTVHRKLERYGL
jgi:transcriptional regulator of acetoin/glycerol metabolism